MQIVAASLCHCTSTAFVGSLQLANADGVSASVMLILHDISVSIILIFPFREMSQHGKMHINVTSEHDRVEKY